MNLFFYDYCTAVGVFSFARRPISMNLKIDIEKNI
jgi:hypothetical protein